VKVEKDSAFFNRGFVCTLAGFCEKLVEDAVLMPKWIVNSIRSQHATGLHVKQLY